MKIEIEMRIEMKGMEIEKGEQKLYCHMKIVVVVVVVVVAAFVVEETYYSEVNERVKFEENLSTL